MTASSENLRLVPSVTKAGMPVPDDIENTLLEFSISDALQAMSFPQSDPVATAKAHYERQKFKIRLASNRERRHSALFLVEKMYAWRGYRAGTDSLAAEEPRRIGLLVYGHGNRPIGTVAMGFDGPDGLLADDMYRAELNAMRQGGKRLLELSRFAIDRHVGSSNRIVAALVNIAYLYGKIGNYDTAVIEVHPRHVAFYQSKFGFEQVGPERICQRVNAPAILLAVDWAYMAAQISHFGGKKHDATAGRSLYRYFFSADDEPGLTKRLTGGDAL
jgi:hypothetical protein